MYNIQQAKVSTKEAFVLKFNMQVVNLESYSLLGTKDLLLLLLTVQMCAVYLLEV